jgi:hypothetical protein
MLLLFLVCLLLASESVGGGGIMRRACCNTQCGSFDAGRRNLYCYFKPFSRCLNVAESALVDMPPPADRISLPQLAHLGSFWLESQVLHYWWQFTTRTAAFVAKKRAQAGVSFRRPTIGMQVRRGDACKADAGDGHGRFCPSLRQSYLPIARKMQSVYGVDRIFMATDDQRAVEECKNWSGFRCYALDVNRKRYSQDAQVLWQDVVISLYVYRIPPSKDVLICIPSSRCGRGGGGGPAGALLTLQLVLVILRSLGH